MKLFACLPCPALQKLMNEIEAEVRLRRMPAGLLCFCPAESALLGGAGFAASRGVVSKLLRICAQVAGTIVKFVADNGKPVTPGQPLVIIKP